MVTLSASSGKFGIADLMRCSGIDKPLRISIVIRTIMNVSSNTVIILILVNLLLLFVGMLIDDIAAMLLMAPLLFPLFTNLGISPLQLAAIMAVNQGTGMLTPPVATNLFVASQLGGMPVSRFIKHTIPFLLLGNIPVLIMVTYIPQVSLWLPHIILGM